MVALTAYSLSYISVGFSQSTDLPTFTEGEFWEFKFNLTGRSRSDMPSGTYRVLYKGGKLSIIDYDKVSTFNANIPSVPRLGKTPPWFQFLTNQDTKWEYTFGREITSYEAEGIVNVNGCAA